MSAMLRAVGTDSSSSIKHDTDVAILTVIPVELVAAREALGLSEANRRRRDGGTVYCQGVVRSELAGRDYRLVLSCIGEAGNPGAADAAREVIEAWRPRAVLLMGIAAGIRDKVRVGEVVLSDRVVSYEPAAIVRAADGRSEVQERPEIDRTPHAMNQDVVHYRGDRARLDDAFARCGWQFPEPAADQVEEFRRHVACAVAPKIATIASGEKLLRDPERFYALREIHGKIEVGEMEAAGFVQACRRANMPWLVIRGISDFGDQFKDDRFHAFAARTAAVVLADFLRHGLDLGGEDPSRQDMAVQATIGQPNPFLFGRPIDRDQDFFGRAAERDQIRDAIDKGMPVQILGEALMGKTSMLRWVQRHAPPGQPVVWLDPTRGLTPATLVQAVAQALGKPRTRNLEALAPFVLLIDDADALAALGRDFDEAFFNGLRALVQARQVTWISASRRNLFDLFQGKGLTSRFLNDARKVRLGPLDAGAARDLAARGGSPHVEAMLRLAGGFAYGLQWLGDRLFLHPDGVGPACDAFASEAESGVFAQWWAGLSAPERQLLQSYAVGEVQVASLKDRERRSLRGLAERGFVREHEGRFVLEGQGWREFVENA